LGSESPTGISFRDVDLKGGTIHVLHVFCVLRRFRGTSECDCNLARRSLESETWQAGFWQVSFWDSMILTAALRARANIVWSEDLNDGQSYDGAVVHNPFSTQQ
jgi:predicted nucleic acid-binding protein